jgi:hypothetical protein
MENVASPDTQPASPAPLQRQSSAIPRWPRRLAVVAWTGWVLALVSLWVQYQLGVYHTAGWLWLPFEGIAVLAGLAGLLVGLSRAVIGPRRKAMFGWSVISVMPLFLTALVVGYMFYEQGHKNLPNTQVHKIGRMAAVTLMTTHAQLRYPHVVKTDRLVMYYDDRVTDPGGDMAAMATHLARLEEVLSRRQHSPIHWVRGPASGMRAMSIHSVALASEVSPVGWFDRHELAHSFLYQFSDRGSEPPMLLLEGWAMAVDGHSEPLTETALATRKQFTVWRGTSMCLRSILAQDLYHVGTPFAYDLGGALVDFLLRRYGADKFLAFYNDIRPESFDADCERVFGRGIDDLEREFWADVESRVKSQ